MKFFIKSFFQDPNFFIEIKKEMSIFFIYCMKLSLNTIIKMIFK